MASKTGCGGDLRADGHMEGQLAVAAKSTESMSTERTAASGCVTLCKLHNCSVPYSPRL